MRQLSSSITTMDQSAKELQEIQESVEAMADRFKERASAIEKSGMPPLEGVMRKKWLEQRELDYRDFLMIADCDITLDDGILTMMLDLRPAICDATLRNSPNGITNKSQERETQVAMENIARADVAREALIEDADRPSLLPTDGAKITAVDTIKVIKKRIGLSGYNPNFDYGGEC